MKAILTVLSILFYLYGTCQKNVLRFQVLSTYQRWNLNNNGWSEWERDKKREQDMASFFTMDATNNILTMTNQFKQQEPRTHSYKINSSVYDTSKAEFGFLFLELKMQTEDGGKVRWVYVSQDGVESMITDGGVLQEKYFLKRID